MRKLNPLGLLDFYKVSHMVQYPEGTEYVYSNFTARSNKHFKWKQAGDGYVVFWGLQGFIKEYLMDVWENNFFKKPVEEGVNYFKRRMGNALGGDISAEHIESLHKLGYLPISIKALPEGSLVPIKVPCFTIKNTNPEFFWLTNSLETLISTEMWKPITTATISYEYRRLFKRFSERTCDDNLHLEYQGHDFSMRGLPGIHDAAKSGAGHLLSFSGTDTVPAIDYIEEYYNEDSDTQVLGCSVPATEHSVMCVCTKSGEKDTFKRLITETYPEGIVSIVSDTWDFWKVINDILPELKEVIENREGKVVIRPDSGCPIKIITGYLANEVVYNVVNNEYTCIKTGKKLEEWEVKGAIQCLWDIFGGHYNTKKISNKKNSETFKVLNDKIGLIYGDSITLPIAAQILNRLAQKGFASSNVILGIGSYTFQYLTRDTFGFAIKATWGMVNGEPRNIYKDPATDDGTKKSACGLLKVVNDNGYKVVDKVTEEEEKKGKLKEVYRNGKLLTEVSFSDIVKRLYLK